MGADHLLGVHGHQVAEQHAGGVQERLAQGDGRQLDGQPARLGDPPPHRRRQLPEAAMARIELAECVEDADDGLSHVLLVEAHLPHEGAPHEPGESRIPVVGQTLRNAFGCHVLKLLLVSCFSRVHSRKTVAA
jgi:hypothetical protein